MKRFLFKFFFVLMALIAAIPAQASYVYFKNTLNWEKVYAYFYSETYWDTNKGSGSQKSKGCEVGPVEMKKIKGTDIFYAENASDYAIVAFTSSERTDYENFWQTSAVYRCDFKVSTPLYTPETTASETKNSNVNYYNNGNWTSISFGLKHNTWNDKGDDWDWKEATDNGNGTFSVVAKYGESGCDYNTKADGTGSGGYIGSPTVVGSPAKGDECTFTLDITNSNSDTDPTITITKKQLDTRTYAVHGTITGDAAWASTSMTDDGNGVFSLTENFVVGDFGIKQMNAEGSQTNWFGYSALGTPADNCEEAKDSNGNSTGNIKLNTAGNYTISINTTSDPMVITVKYNNATAAYYLKHPWDGGTNWTWLPLTIDNGDGTYSLEATYCAGNGCNWNTTDDDAGKRWISNPTVVGNPTTGDLCTFTLDPSANNGEGAITIKRVGALDKLATPTIAPASGTFTKAQVVTITSVEGATIYYTTDGSDPTTESKVYDGSFKVNTVGTTTVKAIAVKEGFDVSDAASATYTINKPYSGDVYISGGVVGNNDFNPSEGNQKMSEAESGIYTYEFTVVEGVGNYWAFRTHNGSAWKWLTNNQEVTPTQSGTYTEQDNAKSNCYYYSGMVSGKKYRITLNTIEGTVSIQKIASGTARDIPVFPLGVNSETELSAYDFEANPVYYLLSGVLNDNRETPEWQMEKGTDGLYHLNGFAMRNTNDKVKVREYTSASTYEDRDSKDFTIALNTSEGQLYNATYDPTAQTLTLTPASATKLPFISLVGYMMQQDQVYTTPRGIESKPADTKTSKGWQESWLQYDANGKLLKDRKGNVMYSTMWPPKNPVYFTATVGAYQRLHSSDQMTFVPVKNANGNNVEKTGKDWMDELKAIDAESYAGLSLDPEKNYYRYVVSDIWYVGAGKIWTGWGGQTTTTSEGKQIAYWTLHKNWGYEHLNATDTEGTPIEAQKTYNVKQGIGNFLFDNPTFFKTFEFFYEISDVNNNSQIYTTLAYGSASIAAQNVKDGDSYTKGSYLPTVEVPEGVSITGWTITRHDATTDALAPISTDNVSDNGLVASGEATDPSSETFTLDKEGLGEGRYYYELVVTFDNGRTSTVRSNPFVIFFPNKYSLDANGYQLVKLDNATDDGYSYATYNAKANGDLYFVEFTDNTVSKFRVATSAERESLNGNFAKNEGIKWTDKVFVYAPVPSEFKIDAEKASATVSLDHITGYDVNNTTGIAPVQDELAVVDLKQNFANKVYKAVMNYQEKDIATGNWSEYAKSSLGKENLTVMQMPNVKGGDVTVNVTATDNSEELTIDYNDVTKTYAAGKVYNVDVTLPFSDPNVEVDADNAPQYDVKVGDITTRYKAGDGNRSVTISNVNPLDFAGKKVEVNAVYYDGSSYALTANIGEAAVMESPDVAFEGCTPNITTMDAIASKFPVYDENNKIVSQKDVIVITKLGFAHEGTNDKIGGENLDAANALYNADFTVESTDAYSNVYKLSDLNFEGSLIEQDGHHVWSKSIQFDNTSGVIKSPKLKVAITPFYVAKVTNTEGYTGLNPLSASQAPVVKAEEATTYVALPCETANAENGGLATGIVDITEGSNMKAYKVIENGEIRIIYGKRKFNVMGAEVK
ncbi:MAG: chitobiase/beta-hexosaminidase C-terminal domain-containing protein [Sodaliphilus sp.]